MLAFFFGGLLVGGSFFHMARVNPSGTMNYLGLADPQLTQLQNAGVRLRIEDKPTYVAVGIKGTLEESEKRANGELVLLYRKAP